MLVLSAAALAIAAAASPAITLGSAAAARLVVIAAACALVEAVSPHGWDNLTMQIVPTAMAWAWLD